MLKCICWYTIINVITVIVRKIIYAVYYISCTDSYFNRKCLLSCTPGLTIPLPYLKHSCERIRQRKRTIHFTHRVWWSCTVQTKRVILVGRSVCIWVETFLPVMLQSVSHLVMRICNSFESQYTFRRKTATIVIHCLATLLLRKVS